MSEEDFQKKVNQIKARRKRHEEHVRNKSEREQRAASALREASTKTVEKADNPITVGAQVRIKGLTSTGTVEAVSGNTATLVVGGMRTKLPLAVKALKEKTIKKIILSRPAVEAGEKLGFLPGDMKDKIDPYLQPLYDALEDMIPAARLQDMMDKHIIQIAPLAFMRGRTLSDAVVILDEAQNTTPAQIRMFLTRMGWSTKMIVTGDLTQIDLPREQKSGLKEAMHILSGIEGISVINLTQKDIVRHKLVTRIVNAYDAYDKKMQDTQKDQKAGKVNIKIAQKAIRSNQLSIIEGDDTAGN